VSVRITQFERQTPAWFCWKLSGDLYDLTMDGSVIANCRRVLLLFRRKLKRDTGFRVDIFGKWRPRRERYKVTLKISSPNFRTAGSIPQGQRTMDSIFFLQRTIYVCDQEDIDQLDGLLQDLQIALRSLFARD
jgi:hypothetical protein